MTLEELIDEIEAQPGDSALDHLAQAAALAAQLDELADHLVGHFVDRARREGASWTTIGAQMGVTKQAAQKRFTAGAGSMDRFTNRAQVVVLKAETDARERGHREVSSVHLVLGLLAEWRGLAGRALKAAGVTRAAVANAATAALPPAAPPTGHHPTTSTGLRKVYELSVREALRLGHNYVGTEHILLALLEAREEPGSQVLSSLGVSKPEVEAWTMQALEDLRSARR